YSIYTFITFFFKYSGAHRDLHSFPTRRSSDLVGRDRGRARREVGEGPPHRSDRHDRDGRKAEEDLRQWEVLEHLACQSFHWLTRDRKSTRLNSSHVAISYAVFCLKKKNTRNITNVVTDGASGVVDIFHGIDKAVAVTWNNFWKDSRADGVGSNLSSK